MQYQIKKYILNKLHKNEKEKKEKIIQKTKKEILKKDTILLFNYSLTQI